MPHPRRLAFVLVVAAAACGTQNLKLAPVKVEPIHMTIDITLHDSDKPTNPKP